MLKSDFSYVQELLFLSNFVVQQLKLGRSGLLLLERVAQSVEVLLSLKYFELDRLQVRPGLQSSEIEIKCVLLN